MFGDNAGYSTFVENGANGIAMPSATAEVKIVINDYQYARVNVKSNAAASFDIYDKDDHHVDSLSFVGEQTIGIDLAHDAAPYKFVQNGTVSGYYKASDKTLASIDKDGTYEVDLSLVPIDLDLSVKGTIDTDEGHKEFPVNNISFAIGHDENSILVSGIIDSENYSVLNANLDCNSDYIAYFGGIVDGTSVSD